MATLLPIVIIIFLVIAVLFGVCLTVFIKSYNSYREEDEELYEDEAPDRARKAAKPRTKPAPPKKPEKPAPPQKQAKSPAPSAEEREKTAPAEPAAAVKPQPEPEKTGSDTRVATPEEMRLLRDVPAGAFKTDAVNTDAAEKPSAAGDETSEADEAGKSKLVPIITVSAGAVAAVCIVALVFVLVNSRKPKETPLPETIAVTTEDVRVQESVTGRITSPDLLTSIFAASGDVQDVKAQEGGFVKKGDVIYVLDSSNLQARIDLLEERLASLKTATAARNVSVTAPSAGTVTDVKVSAGESVTAGTVIAEITGPASHSLSVTLGSAVAVGDKVNVTDGSVTAQGMVTSVKENTAVHETVPETGNDGENGSEAEPAPAEPVRTWDAVIAFTAGDDIASTASVTVGGQQYTGQVTKGRGTVYRATAGINGTVASIKVRPGSSVAAGAAVAEIQTQASAQTAENEFEAKEIQLEIDQKKDELETYTLKAAADGYIQKLFLKKGDKAAVNMNAVTLIPQDSLALKIELDAATAESMTLPAAVSFKINRSGSFPDEVWDNLDTDIVYHVTLDTLSPADGDSGTYVGYIALEDQELFRSGMTANVNVVTYNAYNVPVIPAELVKDGKVNILTADGRVESVDVETGAATGNGGIEIKSGLSSGDRLVVD